MASAEIIADMIVQEALRRSTSGRDLPGKIYEVKMEITLVLMDVLSGIREAETREKGGNHEYQ